MLVGSKIITLIFGLNDELIVQLHILTLILLFLTKTHFSEMKNNMTKFVKSLAFQWTFFWYDPGKTELKPTSPKEYTKVNAQILSAMVMNKVALGKSIKLSC
jgi:hypothetical protein